MNVVTENILDNYPGIAIRVNPVSGELLYVGGSFKDDIFDNFEHNKNITLLDLRSLIVKADQKKVMALTNKHIEAKENWNIEYRVKNKDKTIWLREQAQYSLNEKGSRIDLFIHDVTTFKTQNKKLMNKISEVSKSSDIKNEFFASMSHEIRTPMNAVMGMAQILAKTKMDIDQKQYLDTIVSASDALVQIINDILDVSKLEAGKFDLLEEELDLEQLCLDVCHLLAIRAEEKQIKLFLDFIPAEDKNVVSDGGRIRQILINLIGNAIKFTEEGSVTLVVELESSSDKTEFKFSIKDTGIGIPEKAQKSVFGAFSQVDAKIAKKFGGTGLGLQICEKLVLLMNGEIGLESEIDKGSTFWFSLPMETRETPEITLLNFNEKRCLLVDNNFISCNISKSILEDTNLQVTTLNDSEDALALLTNENVKFNLIVLESELAGLDGLKLAKLIKSDKRYIEVPILLLAPLTVKKDKRQLFGSGINVYLSNPLSPSLLKSALYSLGEIQHKTEAIYVSNKNINQLDSGYEQFHFSGTVLIADDVEVNRFILNSMLSQFGIISDFASNGLEAVEKVKTNNYDLIFMDCRMPVMDGYEATNIIKAMSDDKSKTPIVALTANAGKSDEEACLSAGMDGFMSKPYTEDEIVNTLKTWISHEKTDKADAVVSDINTNERTDIDLIQFDRIRATLGDEFTEFAADLPSKFRVYHQEIIAALRSGDLILAGEKSHALKGLSGMIGAVYISDLGHKLELAAAEKDLESINILLAKLDSAIMKSESIIQINLYPDFVDSVILF